tara:strand:- start:1001 stop:1390 length:390 start_codon:yes stop_codon:yes gene_type:complete
MVKFVRNVQLFAVIIILVSTILAFLFEILKMYDAKEITLADLLLMFIYIEVIGMIRLFWESKSIRITYPLLIAITALARYIILQGKDMNPEILVYEAGAILLISISIVILKLRNSKKLGLDKIKSGIEA